MAVRPGRETITKECAASDPEMPQASCMLPGAHLGNMHWDLMENHGWPVTGAQLPKTDPSMETVQCPNCKTIFDVTKAPRGAAVRPTAKPWMEAP